MPFLNSTRRMLVSSAMTGVVLLSGVGCRDATAPQSPASVSGRWVGDAGVDTWTELRLDQSGEIVTGVYGTGSANFGGNFFPAGSVVGRESGSSVVLELDANGYHYAVRATLSADGQTLSGKMSVNGGPTSAFGPFERAVASAP